MRNIHPPHPTKPGKRVRVSFTDESRRDAYGDKFSAWLDIKDGIFMLGTIRQTMPDTWEHVTSNLPGEPEPVEAGELHKVCGELVRRHVKTYGDASVSTIQDGPRFTARDGQIERTATHAPTP